MQNYNFVFDKLIKTLILYILKITFIGSGNLAWHLSDVLKENGHEIVEIWSKSEENAKLLSNKKPTPKPRHIAIKNLIFLFIVEINFYHANEFYLL